MNTSHHPHHSIIPPYLLREMTLRGDAEARAFAVATLSQDETLRQERTLTSPEVGPDTELETATVGPNRTRRVYTAKNGTNLPGTLLRSEGDGTHADVVVNEAYDGLGSTYDLLWDVFQRNSMNDVGMALLATVHYSSNYNNAFWNGTQMVFGDGDGVYFNRFTAAIDVIGHELAHGVTTHESDLDYSYQSGALNEHCSDVIGSLVKQYAQNPRQTAANADWLIGAGLFTAKVNGVALRSMKAPGTAYDDKVLGKDPQPDHMTKYVNTTGDYGGVHINSGIPNRAFYLAAVAFGGYAWDKAGRIWYATMTDPALRNTAQFQDFANLTVKHALALYGSSAQQTVVDAWKGVGIDVVPATTGGMTGNWMLHFSWGCTSSYAQETLTFNADGTFSGGLAGKWRLRDGTLLLSFNTGPAKYTGTMAGNVGAGAMTTFGGLNGCWYLTRQGTTGVQS